MDGLRAHVFAARRRPGRLARVALLAIPLALVLTLVAIAQEGSGPSGIIDDGWRRIEWQMSGVEIGEHYQSGPDRCAARLLWRWAPAQAR